MNRTRLIITALLILILLTATANVFADEPTPASNAKALDTVWMLVAAFLVFFMQAGFEHRYAESGAINSLFK